MVVAAGSIQSPRHSAGCVLSLLTVEDTHYPLAYSYWLELAKWLILEQESVSGMDLCPSYLDIIAEVEHQRLNQEIGPLPKRERLNTA